MNGVEAKMCDVCKAPAKQSCSSCHSSYYCSRECQKKDWKCHKSNCIPYIIEEHPIYGRYCMATRDIAVGEIIMREVAVVVGPQLCTRPVCLGCHKLITGSNACSKCSIPLCSTACETSTFHESECLVLSKSKRKIYVESYDKPCPVYEFVLPLRCLLTKHTDPKRWKLINNLQDHVDCLSAFERERIRNNIIDFFENFMNFKGVNPEEIYRICGILHTNSFEVLHNGQPVEGVFPKVAMMAHDCSPNTENIFTHNDLRAIVRTTRPIQKGDSITTTYTHLMWNTMKRRQHLLKSKFFACGCQRCCDPTELASNYSTLRCSKCKGDLLPTDPLSLEASWDCINCGNTLEAKDASRTNEILYRTFSERDRSKLQSTEDIIAKCKDILHPNHQILAEAKFAWIKFCGNHPEYRYKDISKVQLLIKISYCKDLLDIASNLFPGRSQIRGFLLFELYAALKAMAIKLLSFGEFNNENKDDYMDEAERCLEEVKGIFCFENELEYQGLSKKLSLLEKDFDL